MASASAFSSSDVNAIEREVDVAEIPISELQIWDEQNKETCTKWIKKNGFKRVCLQLPDIYLPLTKLLDSVMESIASDDVKVFIAADTTYGSCCVDDIAASHVDADCIIHFGNACRSMATRLPVLYLYPHYDIDLDDMVQQVGSLKRICDGKDLALHFDIGYQQPLEDKNEYNKMHDKLMELLQPEKLHLVPFPQPAERQYVNYVDMLSIFIGSDDKHFANLALATESKLWYIYDPRKKTLKRKDPQSARYIRHRLYYIEKCKDARTLGIIVATLSAEGYLGIVAHLQEMAKAKGVRTQIISVGKINPAKLANFMEIDCFVLIGCPFNDMYDSKEFYKPVVSVFDAELALNPAWFTIHPTAYVADFKHFLPSGLCYMAFEPEIEHPFDFSLIDGRLRYNYQPGQSDSEPGSPLPIVRSGLSVEERTWKGLDPALGETEPAEVQKGLKGIPTEYTHD